MCAAAAGPAMLAAQPWAEVDRQWIQNGSGRGASVASQALFDLDIEVGCDAVCAAADVVLARPPKNSC